MDHNNSSFDHEVNLPPSMLVLDRKRHNHKLYTHGNDLESLDFDLDYCASNSVVDIIY